MEFVFLFLAMFGVVLLLLIFDEVYHLRKTIEERFSSEDTEK